MHQLIGTILMFGGDYAPRNFKICDGSVLSIQENSGLFAVIGTTYGGDGITTFALPDLRGRVAIGFGSGSGLTPRKLGAAGGKESEALKVKQLPEHSHELNALSGGLESNIPLNNLIPEYSNPAVKFFAQDNGTTDQLIPMNEKSIGSTGENEPIEKMQPFLTVNFIICCQGIYPSR